MDRVITVQKRFQRGSRKRYIQVPEIKLKGKWLSEGGFNIQGQVKIKIVGNEIIISPV